MRQWPGQPRRLSGTPREGGPGAKGRTAKRLGLAEAYIVSTEERARLG